MTRHVARPLLLNVAELCDYHDQYRQEKVSVATTAERLQLRDELWAIYGTVIQQLRWILQQKINRDALCTRDVQLQLYNVQEHAERAQDSKDTPPAELPEDHALVQCIVLQSGCVQAVKEMLQKFGGEFFFASTRYPFLHGSVSGITTHVRALMDADSLCAMETENISAKLAKGIVLQRQMAQVLISFRKNWTTEQQETFDTTHAFIYEQENASKETGYFKSSAFIEKNGGEEGILRASQLINVAMRRRKAELDQRLFSMPDIGSLPGMDTWAMYAVPKSSHA